MDGSLDADEIALMLTELKKLGYSHDLALTSIQFSGGDIGKAVKYCYHKYHNLDIDDLDATPLNAELQEMIHAVESDRDNAKAALPDPPTNPPSSSSSSSSRAQTPPRAPSDSHLSSSTPMFDQLTPKSEINRKYEFEIEVLLGRQHILKKQLSDLEMEHTKLLNQQSVELEKAEKQGRMNGEEEITQLKMEIASLAEKIVKNEKEYNDSIALLVESSSKQVFSLQEDLAKFQNLLKRAEADRDEARALETFTVERNKQLYAQISRTASGDGIGSSHVIVGGARRSISANSSSTPSSPSNKRESIVDDNVYNNHHRLDDERDQSEVVHAMENIISNLIWFDG